MKIKNKGKVHPSPSSSSSSSSSSSDGGVVLSVLQLLPAAILALASVLSLEDREVLAYMITRSMKTTAPSSSTSSFSKSQDSKKKSSNNNKSSSSNYTANSNHRPPMFDCECFDCYRSYWFRWDSSPNRELIHQAIEAFEDHLANGEKPKKKNAGRGKRSHREAQKSAENSSSKDEVVSASAAEQAEENVVIVSSVPEVVSPACDDIVLVGSPERVEELEEEKALEVKAAVADDMALVGRAAAVSNHKGLARKVLPDVLGLFNSRLWNLWSPNA